MLRRSVVMSGILMLLASAATAADAPKVYDQKCKLCHSIGGEGGKKKDVGGPLDGVGKKRDEEWLRAYIAKPKSKMPEAKMPAIKLSPADFDEIIKFMLALH